ncbi:MAG TPA: phosphoenolpyruvate synthase, partial [Methylophaga sp.]|nr:phosphoenolpyruvate synthase [Methylophaga sp.]
MTEYVIPLDKLCMNDVGRVGGKNASLGEMLQNLAPLGVAVPSGFATTADAYREFLKHDGLQDQINELLRELNVDDVVALQKAGKTIREWIMTIPYPEKMEAAIDEAYEKLVEEYGTSTSWAVRSSATAEDLPDASFAGQQETFLNVSGLDHIKFAIREVFA